MIAYFFETHLLNSLSYSIVFWKEKFEEQMGLFSYIHTLETKT